MEPNTLQNVIFLLTGSIVTIIITKVFELFQSSKAQKFELRKLYFERKISAAEEAIQYLQREIDTVESFMRVYEKIPESDILLLPRLIEEIKKLSEDFDEDKNSLKKISDSMHLYFDFDEYSSKSDLNHKKLLELSLEMHKLDSDMEITAQIYNVADDPNLKEIVFEDIKKRYPQYFPNLEQLVILGRKAISDAKTQKQLIITAMKKYDL